jgi:biopolymer transport protein ExbB/TolQ
MLPEPIIKSLFFDTINQIIYLLAVANFVFLILAYSQILKLKQLLFEGNSVFEQFLQEKAGEAQRAEKTILRDFAMWEKSYQKATKWFYWFVNLISVFPLLGIAGTVWGIIPALSDFENINSYFSVALTSTLLGIVFSVIFKLFEGGMSGDFSLVSERMNTLTSDITKHILEKSNSKS